MRTAITIYLTFLVLFGYSQNDTKLINQSTYNDSIENNTALISGLTILYGHKYYYKNLQTQLNNSDINNYINSVSIGFIGEVWTSFMYDYQSYFFYNYYLPQSIIVNDSNKQKLHGYDIRFSLAGQNIVINKHFHFFLTEGLSFGRIKLVNDNIEKIKNPFFAPYIGLVSGLTFSKFSLVLIGQFDFDISSKKWKDLNFSDSQDIILPNLNQSGFNISIGINLKL